MAVAVQIRRVLNMRILIGYFCPGRSVFRPDPRIDFGPACAVVRPSALAFDWLVVRPKQAQIRSQQPEKQWIVLLVFTLVVRSSSIPQSVALCKLPSVGVLIGVVDWQRSQRSETQIKNRLGY